MELIKNSIPFAFQFADPTQDGSLLYVAGKVYDVTSGSPVFLSTVPMTHDAYGVYVGSYAGDTGKTYLIICASFTDNTYTTPDALAPATSEVQALGDANLVVAFDYTDYGQSPSLFVRAKISNVTSGAPVFVQNVVMSHVAYGCYFGAFSGTAGNVYSVSKMVFTNGTYATPDPSRAPGTDVFQALTAPNVNPLAPSINGVSLEAQLRTRDTLHFTRGDTALLMLVAVDAENDDYPTDLTGATFTTQIKSPNGQVLATFPNGQHTANPDQVNFRGQYVLALSAADTVLCGAGENKQVITKIVIGATTTYYRGVNILTVYPPVPIQ